MDHLISRNAAIKAMLNEQQDDEKAYGCSIPECFDGDRAARVLMQLPYIDADVLLRPIPGYDPVKYTYEYGDVVTVQDVKSIPTVDAVPVVHCKDCINRPFKIHHERESYGFNLDARMKNGFEYYCPFMCEDGWYSTMPEDDFYCKNGKRRTYETD